MSTQHTILGIETSCDETSAAIVRGGRVLSNVTATQVFHSRHGGVVPELASRAHQVTIVPVVEEALQKAGLTKTDLSGVAAVYGPGLVGSILVGLSFGKAYALGLGIPFVGVNHMEAHLLSNLLQEPAPEYPFVNLTVSGGHTQLVLVKKPNDYQLLGETKDDAAGEAFDKVAKMLGLGYPGGPLVDQKAREGDPRYMVFPRPYLEEGSLEFSFSGLKTAVLYALKKMKFDPASADPRVVANMCASFQAAVVDVLIDKLMLAARLHGVKDIAVAGGVAANTELRRRLHERAKSEGKRLFIPPMEYCTDNGAMVAIVGYHKLVEGSPSSWELTAEPNLVVA